MNNKINFYELQLHGRAEANSKAIAIITILRTTERDKMLNLRESLIAHAREGRFPEPLYYIRDTLGCRWIGLITKGTETSGLLPVILQNIPCPD